MKTVQTPVQKPVTPAPKNKKPVHYIMWQCGYGGLELSVRHYIERFSADRDVYVYSLRPRGEMIYDEHLIHFKNGDQSRWACYQSFFKYCRTYQNDQFHVLNIGPIMLIICLLAGVKDILYHIHGTVYWFGKLDRILQKSMWLLARVLSNFRPKIHFVANSKHAQRLFTQQAMPIVPHIVYNGFAVDEFWVHRHRRTRLKKMAYIGRLNPGKNVELVIRLFNAVAAEQDDLELHIAGAGPLEEQLTQLAQQSAYADRIVFHGLVKDIAAFYAQVDLFVFLSAYESFGNVLAEALLTGLPLLTSNIDVFNEIHGGEPAFLLGDPEHYAVVEQNFKQSLDHYEKLAEKAYALGDHVRKKFTIRTHVTAIKKLYV